MVNFFAPMSDSQKNQMINSMQIEKQGKSMEGQQRLCHGFGAPLHFSHWFCAFANSNFNYENNKAPLDF